MKRTLKKYLVPHEDNNHRPHILHGKSVVFLSVFAVMLYAASLFYYPFVLSRTRFIAAILPSVLVDLSNERRIEAKAQGLAVNPLLVEAAEMKANDMASKGYFAHTSPEGIDPWRWMDLAGYSYWVAGENLAVNFTDSEDVIEAWMDSQGHRENLLDNRFTEIGIAIAEGEYKGRRAIFVVQMLGRPQPIPVQTQVARAEEAESDPIPAQQENSVLPASKESIEDTSRDELFTEKEFGGSYASSAEEQQQELKLTAPIAETAPAEQYASGIERMIATPETAVNYVYGLLILLVAVAVALSIFVEVEKRHLPHILYGFGVLVILSGAVFINELELFTSVVIR